MLNWERKQKKYGLRKKRNPPYNSPRLSYIYLFITYIYHQSFNYFLSIVSHRLLLGLSLTEIKQIDMASLDSDVNMIPAGESSSSVAASSSSKKAKRFEVKKWSAVALWAWGNHEQSSFISD